MKSHTRLVRGCRHLHRLLNIYVSLYVRRVEMSTFLFGFRDSEREGNANGGWNNKTSSVFGSPSSRIKDVTLSLKTCGLRIHEEAAKS